MHQPIADDAYSKNCPYIKNLDITNRWFTCLKIQFVTWFCLPLVLFLSEVMWQR